jgi:UDP-N-acetylmuramyl pentapeptide phosphotransferase/UDP-N-acetylglucosamine-1-phosphate transferase
MGMLNLILIGAISFTLGYIGVALIRHWALRRNLLDIPNERSSHTRPIPRVGGLAIVVITLIGFIIIWILCPAWPWLALFVYVSGAILIAVVSWLDDVNSLPNRVRFAVHSLSAAMVIMGIGYWRKIYLPLLGTINLGWLGLAITFMWIVGLINAYNFMDGIDGIAGGQAVVAGLGWTILGWLDNQPLVVALGLLLAASSLGFLGHNWFPARIFMGDVGSAFLGYNFAVLTVVAAQRDPRFALAGVLLVWPFVFDSVFTFLRRLLHRENIFTAHCSHLFQRLVATGFSHKKVASLYIGLAIIGLVCSVSLVMEWRWADYLTTIVIVIASLFLWLGTRWKERSISKTANSL